MNSFHRILLASGFALFASSNVLALQGDDCTDPIPISGTGVFPFTTVGMTGSLFNPGAFGLCEASMLSSAADTFYLWTVPATDVYEFTTSATQASGLPHRNATPYIFLFAGTDCSATCFGVSSDCKADDVAGSSFQAGTLTAGDTYLIRLAWFDMTGTLEIATTTPPPVNDRCSSPMAISGSGTWAFDLGTATTSRWSGYDLGAGEETTSEYILADLFYAWTAPTADDYLFEVDLPGAYPVLFVYDGSDCTATYRTGSVTTIHEVGPARNRIVGVGAGEDYLIQVASWTCEAFGPGSLTVSSNPGAPANDDCSSPTPISGFGTFPVDNSWAANSAFFGNNPQCDNGFVPFHESDVFLTWTAPSDGTFVLSDVGSDFPMEVQLHLGSDCSAVCFDQFYSGSMPRGMSLTAGQDVLIQIRSDRVQVNGFQSQPERLGICNLAIAPAPVGSDCDDPVHLVGTGTFPWDMTGMAPSNLPGTGSGSTCHQDLGESLDQFFLWTVPCAGNYRFDLTSNLEWYQVHLNALDGADCNSTCVASDLNSAQISQFSMTSLLAGQQILLHLSTGFESGAMGDLDITRIGSDCGDLEIVCDPGQPHHEGDSVTLAGSAFAGGLSSGLHLEAHDGPVGEFGMFIMSMSAAGSLPVFEGILCLESPIGRYNAKTASNQNVPGLNSIGQFDAGGVFQNIAGTSTSGSGFDVPVTLPNPVGGQTMVGTTIFVQLWYRDEDAGGAPSANFSNALRATF
tara:strand:- start:5911 stop:8133 length:2223 start_codon:yes stop_codon:yes gene_type:complete